MENTPFDEKKNTGEKEGESDYRAGKEVGCPGKFPTEKGEKEKEHESKEESFE